EVHGQSVQVLNRAAANHPAKSVVDESAMYYNRGTSNDHRRSGIIDAVGSCVRTTASPSKSSQIRDNPRRATISWVRVEQVTDSLPGIMDTKGTDQGSEANK